MTQICDYREQPGCVTVLLTPELARQWVSSASAVTDEATVADYAALMVAGEWGPGSLMSFFADGVLRDGFHRCHGVIRSGVCVEVAAFTVGWPSA